MHPDLKAVADIIADAAAKAKSHAAVYRKNAGVFKPARDDFRMVGVAASLQKLAEKCVDISREQRSRESYQKARAKEASRNTAKTKPAPMTAQNDENDEV